MQSGDFSQWIGREAVVHDVVAPAPIKAFLATISSLECDLQVGDPAPPLSHWMYFLPASRLDQVGADGHPARGGFLPPVQLPRRMWAGGQLEFIRPLRVGASVSRRSIISKVESKVGNSGPLVFVRVEHTISDEEGALIREGQDIVYRGAPTQTDVPPRDVAVTHAQQWARRVDPDPVLLFRYSALTFNGHRIHYDRDYATKVEGYPGLVVHGPLIATLLLHEFKSRHPAAEIATFSFKAIRPLFDTSPFSVTGALDGQDLRMSAHGERGALCMQAGATLR